MSERPPRPFELPARRISRCQKTEHRGHVFFVHCGFDRAGAVREIFVSAKRETTDLIAMLTQHCIDASYRLQYGQRLADIWTRSEFMEKALQVAVVIEREEADAVLAEYALEVAA